MAKVLTSVLQFLGEVMFPGVTHFVVAENFVVNAGGIFFVGNIEKSAKPKISSLNDCLHDDFRSFFYKLEINTNASTLVCGELRENFLDGTIIQSLGGENKAETSLAEVYHLMSLQPNAEEGVLLINGRDNIFYVRDVSGVLWVVYIDWRCGGWCVHVHETSYPHTWEGGSRVFYRK